VAGCTRGPDAPTAPSPTAAIGFEITGPSEIEAGTSAQFSATVGLPGGATQDVTQQTRWGLLYIYPATLASVSATGIVTAHIPFAAITVAGNFEGRHAERTLRIRPRAGTFRLCFTATSRGVVLPGVHIEVTSEPFAGAFVDTEFGGAPCHLYVGGEVVVRATKDGYRQADLQLSVTTNREVVIELEPLRPPLEVAGRYTLTIAAQNCPPSFPAELRTRTFSATLHQGHRDLRLSVTGPNVVHFSFGDNEMNGQLTADGVSLATWEANLGEQWGSIFDRVSATQTVAIIGSATATVAPGGLSGELRGKYGFANSADQCTGPHSFILTR
jgi:hypothetical protein